MFVLTKTYGLKWLIIFVHAQLFVKVSLWGPYTDVYSFFRILLYSLNQTLILTPNFNHNVPNPNPNQTEIHILPRHVNFHDKVVSSASQKRPHSVG